ncbi:helix-turn-helix transcriptional regulator [Neobacillus sp. PS3-34]|uniref:helix-turn-helix domain-containing protein n=1 Tax=Neobacillus sp. PS3-34 TaxID=3070678 RepID=UPI0027E16F4B|nr:helix-turn-helix transcriptional regulator [Neobacillus sp. PS3-34]WML46689.1 helix-turn-helix transcriptional regulator [Neobacillus sp. PS3-34]
MEKKRTIYIGKTIIRLREVKGIKQDELAFRSGITRKYMSNLENDKNSPTLDKLAAIARELDMKTWELVKEAEDKKR